MTPPAAHPAPSNGPDQARLLLRAHGVRPTRQRELVYAALAATDTHPTAEELLTRVHREDPGVSQATVYNTLDALTGCGLARRLASRSAGGPCRYDADVSPHVHLTLPDGRVIDAPDSVSRAILGALAESGLSQSGLDAARIASVHIDLADLA